MFPRARVSPSVVWLLSYSVERSLITIGCGYRSGGADIARFTGCLDGDAYVGDALTQAAVERKFEINCRTRSCPSSMRWKRRVPASRWND